MITQEESQMILFLQLQGPQLQPKSRSFDPGDPALGNAQWLFHSRKVDKNGEFHAGCDRQIPANADPAC